MATIETHRLGTLTFRCRDIGYGVEEGIVDGYFTDEDGGYGKFTFQEAVWPPEHMVEQTMYLFPDEIVVWEPLPSVSLGA